MLFDEHVAWQRRVKKEIFEASKFMWSLNSEKNTENEPKFLFNFKLTRRPSPFVPYKTITFPRARERVYAEVRGKYARPDRSLDPYNLPYVNERTSTVTSSKRTASSVPRIEERLVLENDDNDTQEVKRLLRQERLVGSI